MSIESQLHSSVPFTGMGQRGLRNIITPAFIFQKKKPEPSNLSQLENPEFKARLQPFSPDIPLN